MIVLGLIVAAIWFGVGAVFGVQRAREYMKIENGHRASIAVFLAYCVLGLIGAAIWLVLYTIVIVSYVAAAQAEQDARRKKSDGNSLLALLALLFVGQITHASIQGFKQKGDEFVLRLAVITVFLAGAVGVVIYTNSA